MRIQCLYCGQGFLIDGNAYDTFEGLIRHDRCGKVFWIKTKYGHLVTMDFKNPKRELKFNDEIEDFFKSITEVNAKELVENAEKKENISGTGIEPNSGFSGCSDKPIESTENRIPEPNREDFGNPPAQGVTERITNGNSGKDKGNIYGKFRKILVFNGSDKE